MSSTSISVLAYNRPDTLSTTLTILARVLEPPYTLTVIDNGSEDPRVAAVFQEVRSRVPDPNRWFYVRHDENTGLSIGTNRGLSLGSGDVLIHLDDDALLSSPGWNRRLADFFDRYPEIGLAIPVETPPVESIPHENGAYFEVRWGLGYAWGIRRTLYEEIGGYDPQLMHQNECDLALRVRLAGYRVAAVTGVAVPIHNDPGGVRSARSLAREHLGVVQFRDKYASYFRGPAWNYATHPLYLMEAWPPDQDFLRRFAKYHGIDVNPPPLDPSGRVAVNDRGEVTWPPGLTVEIAGRTYLTRRWVENLHTYWADEEPAYVLDRQLAIDRWFALTGERYEGYRWPSGRLRP
jgi:GT2 family glycosyltransferase